MRCNRWLASLIVLTGLLVSGGAWAQSGCPTVNVYPFKAGCILPANSLNQALSGSINTGLMGNNGQWAQGGALANICAAAGGICPASSTGWMTPNASNAVAPARANLRAYPAFNVKDFGAQGNGTALNDGIIASGSHALNSQSATFAASDVGKTIVVHGAGTAGAPLTTTIATFVDSHDITTTAAASTAVPLYQIYAASINAGGSGGTANAACTLTGSDGTGTKYIINVTLNGSGVATTLGTFTNNGSYSVLPTNLTADPATPSGPCGSLTSVTLTISPTNFTTSGAFQYGTDDSAAITAACNAASAANGVLYFPSANYIYAAQTTACVLANITLSGDGVPVYAKSTGGVVGSQIWVLNSTTPEFTLEANVYWRGLGVWYPTQDGSSSTPTVFPATFQSASNIPIVDDWFEAFDFINPYVLLNNTTLSGGIGRVYFTSGKAYCVSSCLYMTNGGADVVVIGHPTYWGVGADPDATSGFAYLPTWTNANGEWSHFDIGSGGVTHLDGFDVKAQYIGGYEYGVHVLSGLLNGAVIEPDFFDGVLTAVGMTGTGSIQGTVSVPGWIYADDSRSAGAETNAAIACDSAPPTTPNLVDLNIVNTRFMFSRGNAIEITALCYSRLLIGNNTITEWGQSTTAGQYYAITSSNNLNPHFLGITDNTFEAVAPGNVSSGLYDIFLGYHGGLTTITGNRCYGGTACVYDQSGDSGTTLLASNISEATGGTSSIGHAATAGTFVDDPSNVWDKPLPSTIGSGFGTSPSIACPVNWQSCTVTVGSGGASSGVIAFPFTLASAPVCVAVDNTSGAVATAPATTAHVTITATMSAADKVAVQCQGH